MNLEHTHVIDSGIGRLSQSQLLLIAVEKENLLRRVMSRLAKVAETALLANDEAAAFEYSVAINAVNRNYNEAKRWADHYRTTVRQELRDAACANDEASEVQA